MKTILCGFLCVMMAAAGANSADGVPKWNYTPMNTVGVFEGLTFAFFRPPDSVAVITVKAKADGQEKEVTHRISTTPSTETEFNGRFAMPVGNLNTFEVRSVEVVIGKYSSIEAHPVAARDYELSLK
jgi:hypothetical protein